MEERRLYMLAQEALNIRWNETYKALKKDPYNVALKDREKRRWTELMELEDAMRIKGFNN